MIRLHADDQTLVVEQSELLVSGSVNVYQVQFTFSDQWEGLDKTAVFQAWYRTWSVPLDGDTCPIPWEALRRSGGELRAGVYGARDGQLVLPTLWADLGRVQPGASPGEAAQPPTPGVYEQLLAAANQAKQLAQGVRADAEAGRFDGADGASGLLPVARTAAADLTLAANTCTVVEGRPASLNIALGAPVSDTDTEWRLIFRAGENFALADTAPSGYAIQWEAEPVWQAGTIYEVSYGNVFLAGADGSAVIGALWRAWT